MQSSEALETTLPLLSDMLSTTCIYLDLFNKDILLRGQLSIGYDSLFVMMIMKTHTSLFGPRPGQAKCHPKLSLLMTHVRSDCNQTFCDVPTTCRFIGNETISTQPILMQYNFICSCGQPVCSELLLWLRSESVIRQLNQICLCEIRVRPYWLASE